MDEVVKASVRKEGRKGSDAPAGVVTQYGTGAVGYCTSVQYC